MFLYLEIRTYELNKASVSGFLSTNRLELNILLI